MIVGTKDIPVARLRAACSSIESLEAFARKLVPRCFQHVESIVNNQKYLIALQIRQLEDIPYYKRTQLIDQFLKGVVVKGTNTIITIEDVFSEVDYDALLKELFK